MVAGRDDAMTEAAQRKATIAPATDETGKGVGAPYAAEHSSGYAAFSVKQWGVAEAADRSESVAEEMPIALTYNGASFAVMMATPRDLEDFGVGFSLSEAIVAKPEQIEALRVTPHPDGLMIEMQVPSAASSALQRRQRNLVGRGGCGICGERSLHHAVRRPARIESSIRIEHRAIDAAVAQLSAHQPLNALTGALHAAGWARADGMLVCVREDVGRHNALDKLIGALIRAGEDPSAGFAMITSRASYELVQKSATCGIGALAAISAPTALAIRLAEQVGLALIGFARPGRHTLYADPNRIIVDEATR